MWGCTGSTKRIFLFRRSHLPSAGDSAVGPHTKPLREMGCRGKRDGVAITCGFGLRLNVLINSHIELESALTTQDFAQNLRDTMQCRWERKKKRANEWAIKREISCVHERGRERQGPGKNPNSRKKVRNTSESKSKGEYEREWSRVLSYHPPRLPLSFSRLAHSVSHSLSLPFSVSHALVFCLSQFSL